MSHGRVDGKTQNVTRNYSWLEAFKNATTLDCWDAINQLLLLHGAQTSQGAAATQEGNTQVKMSGWRPLDWRTTSKPHSFPASGEFSLKNGFQWGRIKTNRVTADKQLRAALNINTVKRGGRKIVAVERRRFTVPNSSFFWAAVTRKALPLSDLTVISTVYLCGGFCGCHGYNSQPTRGKLRKFNHHKNPLKATLIHKAEAEVNCRGVRSCEVVLRTRTHCRSVWTTAAPAGCAMAWRSSADATFRVRSSIWKHFTVGVVKTSSKDTGKDFCELLSSQANE